MKRTEEHLWGPPHAQASTYKMKQKRGGEGPGSGEDHPFVVFLGEGEAENSVAQPLLSCVLEAGQQAWRGPRTPSEPFPCPGQIVTPPSGHAVAFVTWKPALGPLLPGRGCWVGRGSLRHSQWLVRRERGLQAHPDERASAPGNEGRHPHSGWQPLHCEQSRFSTK